MPVSNDLASQSCWAQAGRTNCSVPAGGSRAQPGVDRVLFFLGESELCEAGRGYKVRSLKRVLDH